MMRNMLLIVAAVTSLAALGARALAADPPATAGPPAGPGLDLINQRCIFCHNTAQIFSQHKSPEAWAVTVEQMASRGAELSPEEMKIVTDYLAKNYAGPAAPAASPSPPPKN